MNPADEREYSKFYDYQIRYGVNEEEKESQIGFEILDSEFDLNEVGESESGFSIIDKSEFSESF